VLHVLLEEVDEETAVLRSVAEGVGKRLDTGALVDDVEDGGKHVLVLWLDQDRQEGLDKVRTGNVVNVDSRT